jgi:polysaccharide export outer membrane protein
MTAVIVTILVPFSAGAELAVHRVFSPMSGSASAAEAGATDESFFTIHTGDKLKIEVFREKELSGVFTVNQSGLIAYPLLGEVYVDGLSIDEFKKYLTSSLSEFLVNPQIQIEFEESPNKSIAILGQVARPGNYTLIQNLTLVRLVSQVGSFSPNANTKEVRVIREDKNGKRQFLQVDVQAIMRGEAPDMALAPGDMIYVDKLDEKKEKAKDNVSLLGQVSRPGNYDFTEGLTLVKLISQAGGFTGIAAPGRVKITRRGPDGKLVSATVDVMKILDGKTEDVVLQIDDVIVVPESFF